MNGILGKKLGMTHIYSEDGRQVPVTVIEAGPCFVLQIKTEQQDEYAAVQVGFDDKPERKTNRPQMGHFKKAEVSPKRYIKELFLDAEGLKVGEEIKTDGFKPGDFVDITGVSIGKGFQGGVKRWGWRGGEKSHGSMFHRRVGSIGASSNPSRVFKGQHMPGQMGGKKRTVQNLEVVKVDIPKNLLVVKGAVPGHKKGYVVVRSAKKK